MGPPGQPPCLLLRRHDTEGRHSPHPRVLGLVPPLPAQQVWLLVTVVTANQCVGRTQASFTVCDTHAVCLIQSTRCSEGQWMPKRGSPQLKTQSCQRFPLGQDNFSCSACCHEFCLFVCVSLPSHMTFMVGWCQITNILFSL